MKIIFVGNVLPEEIFAEVSNVSPSTNNVQLTFLKNLAKAFPGKVSVVSHNWSIQKVKSDSLKKVPAMKFELSNGIVIETVEFNKSRILMNISALISLTRKLRDIRKQYQKTNPKEPILFLVMNPFYGLALPAIIAKKRNDCFITILCEGLDIRYLQERKVHLRDHFLNFLHKAMFRKNDGVITFCEESIKKYAPDMPHVFLIHTCDINLSSGIKKQNSSSGKILLYAGLIAPCYGIHLILDAMKLLPDYYSLLICGGGDRSLIEQIKKAEEKDPRIHYLGLVSRSAVLDLEKESDILLMIRTASTQSERYIATYCQPSKLPEYLLSGTPILATDIPAIPSELKPYLCFTVADYKTIAEKIRSICETDQEIAKQTAEKAIDFAKKNCSSEAQGEKMIQFIRNITTNKWSPLQ